MTSSFGQIKTKVIGPPRVQTKAELDTERRNHDCIRRYKMSFSNRLRKYPFNIASQIRLVSYLAQPLSKDNPEILSHTGLPIENDTICYSKLNEIVTLRLGQIDTLTDILYNVGFRGPTFIITSIQCYEPRNAILFIDSKGKTVEYIEICFGCDKTRESSEKIPVGEFCKQKFEILRKYFLKAGVKYGTSNEEPSD